MASFTQLRQRFFTKPFIKFLKNRMPPISDAERDAIEAGNVWWEKELFCGKPDWQQLFSMPKSVLTAEEQGFLDNQVETLCAMINDWDIIFHERKIPDKIWDYIKQEKFLGLVIPKEYGGLGFSALAHSSIIQKISTRSASVAVATMVPNSLGPGEMLMSYGTPEQKKYFLPRLASGEEIPCFALTAPDAGSDASSIPDRGVVCKGQIDGREVMGIRLNWDKRYITLAPIATLLGIAFHLYDPEKLLGDKTDIGITLALIPTNTPGVEIGTRHYPLMQAFMNGPTRGKDVFIPLDYVIGGKKNVGKGWRMLMECLSIGRSISLPALSTACGKLTYRYTGAYARLRQQFNLPISAFEGIQEALGYVAGYTYTLEACRLFTASAIDKHLRPSTASAIAKYHMTEMARVVVAHAMDVHAGHMIQLGPRNFLASQHIAIPICITVEGANILTRNLIIFGQGAIRCHPYVLKEMTLMAEPDLNFGKLDELLFAHLRYFLSNLMRSFFYGLTGGFFISLLAPNVIKSSKVKSLQKQLTRMSTALAVLSDACMMLLGGSLKRKERVSARLGDVLSQLYLASAVLKYFHDQGQPAEDIDNVCWSLQNVLQKIQSGIYDLLNNFPSWWLGKMLKWMIFPFGIAYAGPKDGLHASIVQPMLVPSAFRDRLTVNCYKNAKQDELISRLDLGLEKVATADLIWSKVQNQVRHGKISAYCNTLERIQAALDLAVITGNEAEMLREFDVLRNEIIRVDEFSSDLKQIIA